MQNEKQNCCQLSLVIMFQWLLVVIFSVIIISNSAHSFNIINDPKTGLGLHPPKTPTTNDEFFNDNTNSTYNNTNITNTTTTTNNKNDKNCTQQQQQQHKQYEGHEEYNAEIRPCMFCNQSVSCDPDYLVCRENVCMLDDYEGNLFVALKCFALVMLGAASLYLK